MRDGSQPVAYVAGEHGPETSAAAESLDVARVEQRRSTSAY